MEFDVLTKIKEDVVFEPSRPGCVLNLSGLPGAGSRIYDRSPYGNIGTISGATWVRLSSGLWVLSFDGSDDFISIASAASLDITTAITLMAWIKETATGYEGIIDKPSGLYSLRALNNLNWFRTTTSSGIVDISDGTSLADSKWHLVAGTYDGANMNLYLDGKLDGTSPTAQTGTINTANNVLEIGRYDASNTRAFTGNIALVRVYNRALSILEIASHFNQERHLFGA